MCGWHGVSVPDSSSLANEQTVMVNPIAHTAIGAQYGQVAIHITSWPLKVG